MASRVVTDATFEQEVIGSPQPVLVDFTAGWCGPCRAMNPILDELAEDYAGRFIIVKIEIDDSPSATKKYKVMSIPNIKFFLNGLVVDELVGAVPKHELSRRIDAVLQKYEYRQ